MDVTISFTLSGATSGPFDPPYTIDFITNEADGDRLQAWLVSAYSIDDDGNPRTPHQMFDALCSAIISGMVSNSDRYHKQLAAEQSIQGVNDIVVVRN